MWLHKFHFLGYLLITCYSDVLITTPFPYVAQVGLTISLGVEEEEEEEQEGVGLLGVELMPSLVS